MKQCDLLIFGATRNTGLLIAQQAKAKGLSVAAMVRPTSDTAELKQFNIDLYDGDAFEPMDCDHIFAKTKPRWVVSVLGGKNTQGRRVDAEGNMNIIHAAQHCLSVTRFLLMTSMGCGDQYENTNEQVKKFLGEALRAKSLAEDLLQTTTLPWVILRPGGLNHLPPTGKYCLLLHPDSQYSSYISRADVATAVLEILEKEHCLHQIFTLQGDATKKEISS